MALPNHQTRLVCGIDEAGRGPLAGPVCAAAVAFLVAWDGPPLADSKRLKSSERDLVRAHIDAAAADGRLVVGIGWALPAEIDRINILQATMRAMERAWRDLLASGLVSCSTLSPASAPGHWFADGATRLVLVDGNRCPPGLTSPCEAVIGGDHIHEVIMAASVVAKTTRDRLMEHAEALYPGYGFAQHKGYPTAGHRAALDHLGLCPLHRRSFNGVGRRS